MPAQVPASLALDQAQEIKTLRAALDLAAGEVERLRADAETYKQERDEVSGAAKQMHERHERETAALRAALDKFMAFDMSPMFDARGSYSERKSQELRTLQREANALLADAEGQRAAEPARLPKQVICTKCGYVASETGPLANEWRAYVVLRDAAWIYRTQWLECHEPPGEARGDLVSLGYARGALFAAVEAARR